MANDSILETSASKWEKFVKDDLDLLMEKHVYKTEDDYINTVY